MSGGLDRLRFDTSARFVAFACWSAAILGLSMSPDAVVVVGFIDDVLGL